MKILLLGGTGAMGIHLCQILADRGDEVYITSRKKRTGNGRIHYIQGNAQNLSFVASILKEGWDAVVDFMIYPTDVFYSRIALFLDSTKQYIFLSSSRVYSDKESPIKETTLRLLDASSDKEFLATDEYSLKKAREEDFLFNSGRKNFTIIRPYITYSENRMQLGDLEHSHWLYRALDGRTIVFSDDIANHYTTLTYGYDVAKGIASTIGIENALGEAFHITGNISLKWSEILKIYLNAIEKATGVRPKVKIIPTSLKLKLKDSQYQIRYDRLYDRKFDNAKILSIDPSLSFISPEEGLTKCVEAYIKDWRKTKVSYLEEAERDCITKEHIKLNTIKSSRDKVIYFVCRYLRLSWVLRKIAKI